MKNTKIGPWHAVLFCTFLSGLTVIVNILTYPAFGGINSFLCFLPMCFFFGGAYMDQLRKENDDLRQKLDELIQVVDNRRGAA